MPQTIEGNCDPSCDEEECRRRLSACYALLLDLAQKRRSKTSSDVPALNPVDPVGTMNTESQGYPATNSSQEL